jgi:hypothetical protein
MQLAFILNNINISLMKGNELKFVKFTEHNDNEGESWNFWLQLDGNEAQLKQLQSWLGTFDDDGGSYELDMTPVDESEVDILVKHSDEGYMDYENKITGTFACPEPDSKAETDPDEAWEWLNDSFYKGDIARYFK